MHRMTSVQTGELGCVWGEGGQKEYERESEREQIGALT
jgi:hypothetical protein